MNGFRLDGTDELNRTNLNCGHHWIFNSWFIKTNKLRLRKSFLRPISGLSKEAAKVEIHSDDKIT
jgi:hypothetical protein